MVSQVPGSKADDLARMDFDALRLVPVDCRYEASTVRQIGPLARRVLVGVDHNPSRWEVQKAAPDWLGIGATTHWCAMASFHRAGLGCAQCLHPTDDPRDGPIPTVAFVSFWAGLMLATYFIRHAAGENIEPAHQQIFMTPLRPERPWRSPVAPRADCPLCTIA